MTNQGLRTRVWAWMCILIVSDAYGPAYATVGKRPGEFLVFYGALLLVYLTFKTIKIGGYSKSRACTRTSHHWVGWSGRDHTVK